MLIATWNLNHRVGYTTYRPETARSIAALRADVLVLTEYFPQDQDAHFRSDLQAAGYLWLSGSDNRGIRALAATSNSSTCGRVKLLHPGAAGRIEL